MGKLTNKDLEAMVVKATVMLDKIGCDISNLTKPSFKGIRKASKENTCYGTTYTTWFGGVGVGIITEQSITINSRQCFTERADDVFNTVVHECLHVCYPSENKHNGKWLEYANKFSDEYGIIIQEYATAKEKIEAKYELHYTRPDGSEGIATYNRASSNVVKCAKRGLPLYINNEQIEYYLVQNY